MKELKSTQYVPIAMIQRVISRRDHATGTSSLTNANTITGRKQAIVFTVIIANAITPRQFLRNLRIK